MEITRIKEKKSLHTFKDSTQGNPNLYLDGILALSIEVTKWEILLLMLEK